MPSLRIQLLRGLLAAPLCLAMLAGHALSAVADTAPTSSRTQTAPRACDARAASPLASGCIAVSMPGGQAAEAPACAT